jgi:hypothetical protein
MRLERAVCLVAAVTLFSSAHAQWRDWEGDFEEDKKSWKEIQAQIPPYPKAANLVRIKTGVASGHTFYIDTTSISLGEDGVVRYTAVIKAAGGAMNVMFEGLRCDTREQKVYALGHPDASWVRARNTKWERVMLRELTPYRHTLYHEFFCHSRTQPTPVKHAVEALKRGQGFRPSSPTD